MAVKLEYGPNNLAFYTTWWLNSKPSDLSHINISSSQLCDKPNDECIVFPQIVDEVESQVDCCLPFAKFLPKR
ncbi:hypothetical protein I4U23_024331 [Adineta vaga]|nr:hypothetical protein I4U23_024331 [Adineta vaga]